MPNAVVVPKTSVATNSSGAPVGESAAGTKAIPSGPGSSASAGELYGAGAGALDRRADGGRRGEGQPGRSQGEGDAGCQQRRGPSDERVGHVDSSER